MKDNDDKPSKKHTATKTNNVVAINTKTCQVVTMSDKKTLGGIVHIIGKGYYVPMEEYVKMLEALATVSERLVTTLSDKEKLAVTLVNISSIAKKMKEEFSKNIKK